MPLDWLGVLSLSNGETDAHPLRDTGLAEGISDLAGREPGPPASMRGKTARRDAGPPGRISAPAVALWAMAFA